MRESSAPYGRPRLRAVATPAVIDFVADTSGGRIVEEHPAEAGFTHSVASIITAQNGAELFVKAGLISEPGGSAVRAGNALSDVVGDLGPALFAYAEIEGWAVALYERLEGEAVTTWQSGDFAQLQRLSHDMRERLDPSPLVDTESYAREFAPLLGTWEALNDPESANAPSVAHVRGKPLPYGLDVGMLAELETEWDAAVGTGTGNALQHGDIRRDNVMREPSGRLRLVDWTHHWRSPGWCDWVRLAPDVAADGFDAESVLQHSAWIDADAHGVNVMLAGLAGRCWRDGHLSAVSGLPQLRPMQLLQGDMSLLWLSRRLARH